MGTPPSRPPAQVQPETDVAGDPPGGGDGAGDDDERARLQAELARLKGQFTTGSKALTESNARSQELCKRLQPTPGPGIPSSSSYSSSPNWTKG